MSLLFDRGRELDFVAMSVCSTVSSWRSLPEFKERNYIGWEMSSLALSYLLSCGEPPILIQRRQPRLPYDCVTPAVAA